MSTLVPISLTAKGELYFTDDRERIDMEFLLPAINATYFGATRTRLQLLKAINGSLCFSIFWRDLSNPAFVSQVGFARVVTDYTGFGWLCDVVISSTHRRRGFGTKLMQAILSHPSLAGVTINLGTRDSHAFYAQFGFEKCEQMMRRAG